MSEEVKKKPGRPKKKVTAAPIEVRGIVDKPENPDDLLEMVYSNPMLFKRLLQLYKAFEVDEIEMLFDKNGVKIVTKDHLGKSTIYTLIEARSMVLYYCAQPIRVCIKRENLDKVLGYLTKNHHKITFVLKQDYRSTIHVIIQDLEYNNFDSYEIDVIAKNEDNAVVDTDDDSNYPIRFKMSSKHFKSKISNISKLSSTFTIQKWGTQPLQFTFDKAQKVNWTGVYGDSSKIELTSTLAADEIFNVSVYICHIRPFSNSNIGEEVTIAADQQRKICFTTKLDQCETGYAATIKIFTEIK